MADKGDWISIVRGIIQRMEAADVTEMEVRQANLRLRLRRVSRAVPALRMADPASLDIDERIDLHQVIAPLTGVYYAASSPSGKPYVALGDWVERDSVVGLIETMKVFNEVTADCRGRVAAILAQQGQLIHAGDAILLVDTAVAPDHAGEVTE